MRLLLVIAVATWATGCATTSSFSPATQAFGEEYFCPAHRLQVRTAAVQLPEVIAPKELPAEIAQDPERLELWNQTFQRTLAFYQRLTAVDVTGCGGHETYFCWFENGKRNRQACDHVDLDAPQPGFALVTLKPTAGQWVRVRLGPPTTQR
jgi:hypothetical protein